MLTNEWEEFRIIKWHHKKVDKVPSAAGFEVAKW